MNEIYFDLQVVYIFAGLRALRCREIYVSLNFFFADHNLGKICIWNEYGHQSITSLSLAYQVHTFY